MNNTFPFLYQHRLYDLVYFPEKALIQAGPCMGKSVFIEKLRDAFKENNKETVYIKSSRKNEDNDREKIIDWYESNTQEILLIDNLDYIYDDNLEEIFRRLNQTPERIIIATSHTPSRANFLGSKGFGLNESFKKSSSSGFNKIIVESFGLTSFASMWLTPWDGQWQKRTQVIIKSVLRSHANAIKEMPNGHNTAQFLINELDHISQEALVVSGGHPYLLNRTIMTFIRQLTRKGSTNDKDFNANTIKSVFLISVPIVKETCNARIYEEFEWAKLWLPTDIYQTTLRNTLEGKEAGSAIGTGVLHHAGILNNKGSKVSFTCGIIQEVAEDVLNSLNKKDQSLGNKKPTVSLKSSRPDNTKGNLIFHIPGEQDLAVELSPTEWEIILYMEKNDEELVTVKELINSLAHHSEASIRSALQRLINKLSRANIQNLLINRPRKGYIYNPSTISITAH